MRGVAVFKMAFVVALVALFLAGCTNEVKEIMPTSRAADNTTIPGTVIANTRVPTARPTEVPTPTQAAAPKVIGQPTALVEARGARYSLTVNAIRDSVPAPNQFNVAKGRWVLVDWTVRNDGAENVSFNSRSLKLQSADNFVFDADLIAGNFGVSILDSYPTLGPGQIIRGFLAYDVPIGTTLGAAIYHPSGSPQFVVANLP